MPAGVASKRSPSERRQPPCRHRRHQMPHARCRSTASSSGTVTDPVRRPGPVIAHQVDDHDVLRDILGRRPKAAGSACAGSVPLIGLDVIASPHRRRNSSGDSDATAPHSPRGRPRGPARCVATARRRSRPALRRAGRRTACTRTPGTPRLQRSPPGSRAHRGVRGPVGVAPGDDGVAGPGSPKRFGHPGGKCGTREAFVPPLPSRSRPARVRPAARSLRDPRPQPVGPRIGIGQIAEPATADGLGGRRSPHRRLRRRPGLRQRRRDYRARAEPVADQGGGRGQPRRRGSERAQHRRGTAQLAEPLDAHQ